MTPEEELNKKWSVHDMIQEAMKTAHITPAPETLSRLDNIDKKLEENYSKRELDEHFKDVKDSIEEIRKLGTSIDAKVGIQNGRVTKTEIWMKAVIFAGSCAFVLVGIIGSLIVYSFQLSQDNLKNTILLQLKP